MRDRANARFERYPSAVSPRTRRPTPPGSFYGTIESGGEAFRKILRGCARIDGAQEMARWMRLELEELALPLTKQKS
jgi:hypothetical protein